MISYPTPYYSRDGIVIYNCDAEDIIGEYQVDLMVTDPPYGIGEAAGKNAKRGTKDCPGRDWGSEGWDDAPVSQSLIDVAVAAAKYAIVFGGNYYAMPPSSCWLVWDKENGTTAFADCELAWTNLPKATRLLRYEWNGMLRKRNRRSDYQEARVHPTQKPEAVIAWAISQVPGEPKTLLDPFMGSGTSLVVAKKLGMQAIGIERETKYCEAAVNRLRQGMLEFAT